MSNDGRCRYDCRTARENWIDGYVAGAKGYNPEHPDYINADEAALREEANDVWKRGQETRRVERRKFRSRTRTDMGIDRTSARDVAGGEGRISTSTASRRIYD